MSSHWTKMHAQARLSVPQLQRSDLPRVPGVYAFYRDGEPTYVGMAKDLRDRVWGDHMSMSKSMHTSALRRNVAEQLGIASAADIYERRHRCSARELACVRALIEESDVAWKETQDVAEAARYEDALKSELMPPLTKA